MRRDEALEETGLKTLGEPSFDTAEFKTDQDFTFEITVEVEPDVEVSDYKGLELKRPAEEVSDEQVDVGMKSLLRQIATAGAGEGGRHRGAGHHHVRLGDQGRRGNGVVRQGDGSRCARASSRT